MQDPIEYQSYTWHTNLDTYERIVEDDVKKSAAMIASALYHLAMRDDLLPRFTSAEMPAPTPARARRRRPRRRPTGSRPAPDPPVVSSRRREPGRRCLREHPRAARLSATPRPSSPASARLVACFTTLSGSPGVRFSGSAGSSGGCARKRGRTPWCGCAACTRNGGRDTRVPDLAGRQREFAMRASTEARRRRVHAAESPVAAGRGLALSTWTDAMRVGARSSPHVGEQEEHQQRRPFECTLGASRGSRATRSEADVDVPPCIARSCDDGEPDRGRCTIAAHGRHEPGAHELIERSPAGAACWPTSMNSARLYMPRRITGRVQVGGSSGVQHRCPSTGSPEPPRRVPPAETRLRPHVTVGDELLDLDRGVSPRGNPLVSHVMPPCRRQSAVRRCPVDRLS